LTLDRKSARLNEIAALTRTARPTAALAPATFRFFDQECAMNIKTQQQYAETFHGLHKKGDPLVLFNAWDVATAKAIAKASPAVAKASPAVATSSGAVASALGYADGENAPFDMVISPLTLSDGAVQVG
jgi:hypothetical protein